MRLCNTDKRNNDSENRLNNGTDTTPCDTIQRKDLVLMKNVGHDL